MKKIINGSTIKFYDDNDKLIMNIDYPHDECIWFFYSGDVITITKEMELYNLIEELMNQNYTFNDNSVLKDYKDENYLKWYSDRYYNPDDEFSYNSVSYLNIKRDSNCFKIWCTKPIDKIFNRPNKTHAIAFSPLGNGKYSKNLLTGITLQDDFVINVYKKLIMANKNKKLSKKIGNF